MDEMLSILGALFTEVNMHCREKVKDNKRSREEKENTNLMCPQCIY